jgi:hypothetical protein
MPRNEAVQDEIRDQLRKTELNINDTGRLKSLAFVRQNHA